MVADKMKEFIDKEQKELEAERDIWSKKNVANQNANEKELEILKQNMLEDQLRYDMILKEFETDSKA
jgi:hypothetical protein